MKRYISSVAALALVSAMTVGCSGGSNHAGTVVATEYNAIFVDSAVQGVSWKCGENSGVTDATGLFGTCKIGDPVSFSIGNLSLGTIADTSAFGEAENQIITPTVIEEASGKKDVAVKIAVTLQSLDADGDPTNGITITEATIEVLNETVEAGSDITAPELTVEEVVSEVAVVVEEAKTKPGNEGMTAKTQEEAEEHLEETEKAVEEGKITPPEQPNPSTGAAS